MADDRVPRWRLLLVAGVGVVLAVAGLLLGTSPAEPEGLREHDLWLAPTVQL